MPRPPPMGGGVWGGGATPQGELLPTHTMPSPVQPDVRPGSPDVDSRNGSALSAYEESPFDDDGPLDFGSAPSGALQGGTGLSLPHDESAAAEAAAEGGTANPPPRVGFFNPAQPESGVQSGYRGRSSTGGSSAGMH